MCFSATASFGAAAVLGVLGIFTLKAAKKKSLLPLACIPLFFALQQLSEGFVWLSLQNTITDPKMADISIFSYLFFVFFLWPLWIPLSLLIAEKIAWRRVLLCVLFLFGLMLSLMSASYVPDSTLIAKIVHRKIEYSMSHSFEMDPWLIIGWYTVVVILPTLISSLEMIWLFGLGLLLSWVASEQLFHDNFTSTWCFFSAFVSFLIYLVVKTNSKNP